MILSDDSVEAIFLNCCCRSAWRCFSKFWNFFSLGLGCYCFKSFLNLTFANAFVLLQVMRTALFVTETRKQSPNFFRNFSERICKSSNLPKDPPWLMMKNVLEGYFFTTFAVDYLRVHMCALYLCTGVRL
jgi:hypothetical protein